MKRHKLESVKPVVSIEPNPCSSCLMMLGLAAWCEHADFVITSQHMHLAVKIVCI